MPILAPLAGEQMHPLLDQVLPALLAEHLEVLGLDEDLVVLEFLAEHGQPVVLQDRLHDLLPELIHGVLVLVQHRFLGVLLLRGLGILGAIIV